MVGAARPTMRTGPREKMVRTCAVLDPLVGMVGMMIPKVPTFLTLSLRRNQRTACRSVRR